ncbi:MAG: helix-turn-helix transcriptional regulator [Syntrophales bacterium]
MLKPGLHHTSEGLHKGEKYLRSCRQLTQEALALRLKTQKTAISRIENHAEDIKLSTLDRVAKALGKRLDVRIA